MRYRLETTVIPRRERHVGDEHVGTDMALSWLTTDNLCAGFS